MVSQRRSGHTQKTMPTGPVYPSILVLGAWCLSHCRDSPTAQTLTQKRAWVKDLRDSSPSFPPQGAGCGVKAGLPTRHLVTHREGGPGREDSQTSTRLPITGTVAPGLAAMKGRPKKGKATDCTRGKEDMDRGHGAPSVSKLLAHTYSWKHAVR